jgi:hypothetical protein
MPPLASKMRSFGARNGLPPMPSVTVVTVPSRRRLLIRLPSPSAASRSGVGDGEVGRAPLRDHLWQGPPVTRNAEIDPGDNDPPPKMTQGVMTPPNPPSSPSTASSSGVARCWHSNAYFSLFSSLFFFDPPNRFVQIPRDLS